MKIDKDFSNLERDIAISRRNYHYHKHSFGSLMNVIAEPNKHLKRDLEPVELRHLGDKLKQIQNEDFSGSLYFAMEHMFSLYSNENIVFPLIDEFKKFNLEYDFVKHLVLNRNLSGLKLDDLAKFNLNMIKLNPNNNQFKNLCSSKIDLLFLEGEKLGFNGFASMRRKSIESSIKKYLLEHFDLRYPNEVELEKRGFFQKDKTLEYCQDKCYDDLMGIEEGALHSGEDIYNHFRPYFEMVDEHTKERIRSVLNKYFVDYVGGKIVAPKSMIEDIDKNLKKRLGDKLRRLPFRTKDYLNFEVKDNYGNVLKKGIKDHSITHAFNGNFERSAIEIKFIPLSEGYNAEIGENNHASYSYKQYKTLSEILENYEELNYMFANLCYAGRVTPQNVLGPLYKLPLHEAYSRFNWYS